jgi:Gluconate 2-dehydrogenase subunit 3
MSDQNTIDRREAIRRVSALLGGVAFVGGSSLLTACEQRQAGTATQAGAPAASTFTADEVAFLDEVAETILPETTTPGAKAARTGELMALMVNDTYDAKEQQIFRDGMKKLDEASKKMNGASFMASTPQQRLALLESLDKEQKAYMDSVEAARAFNRAIKAQAEAKRDAAAGKIVAAQQGRPVPDATITADSPPHYFRMMKELSLLGFFTSEVGMTKAMRYVESPGRFDPCLPYKAGEKAWADHA